MAEQTRDDVTGFDAVELRGVGKLFVEQGEKESVRIVAEEDTFDKIITTVEGTTLVIKLKVLDTIMAFKPVGSLEYHVTVRDLTALSVKGAGRADASVAVDHLSASLSGAGQIRLGIRVQRLDASVSGTGGFSVKGEADVLAVSVSGMGEFRGEDLVVREASVSISGAGSASVHASERLDASISGAGTITYSGEPQVSERISGVGKVERAR